MEFRWRTFQGCVEDGRDGLLRVDVRHAGYVDLDFEIGAARMLEALIGVVPPRCS